MKERTKPSNHPINNNQGSTPSGVPVKHSRPLFPVYSTTHNDPAAPPREIYDCNTSTDKQPVGVAAMKENLYYNANIETPPAPGSKGVNGCLNGIDTPLATQLLSIPGAQKIYDRSRDTTYVKGRLLGKVSSPHVTCYMYVTHERYHILYIYMHVQTCAILQYSGI